MTSKELEHKIISFCEANKNEARIEQNKRFFKNGEFLGYGLAAPQIYDEIKNLLKMPGMSLELALEVAPNLLSSKMYEPITMGLLLVNAFGKQFSKALFHEMSKWYSFTIHNWAHADTMGMFILPQFVKYKVITYVDFAPWLTSKYKFQRRSVSVTLIKLLKSKTIDDFNPIFNFLEPLMTDPEREVHQGMGWFLREAWKLKPGQTEPFLLKWKDTAPRLIINYATEKMTKEQKIKFKKA
jgi:Predicted DNA alkylation repair enzyme